MRQLLLVPMTVEADEMTRSDSAGTGVTVLLDVIGEMTEMTSKGEALWSWPTGGELADSSSENELQLSVADSSNWTFYLNETDESGGPNGTNWWTSPVYPSGYTPLGLVIASIFVTFIMILIVGGNIMVIIAIATERSLKGIQNWFIASLAVADCLLGGIIMPFSLANEMMGYWVFGQWWCDIHSAVDVLLCTSSIMNLCLISLDRYWSITHAIEYLRKRTPERVVIMIATVWILSGLVSIPPLLGWKKETPQGEFPKCELSEDIGYVLYSALGSFYIPSCIMVFVYIRIYFAARARARRAQENKIKRKQSQSKEQKEKEQQMELQQQQMKEEKQHQEQIEMVENKVGTGTTTTMEQTGAIATTNGSAATAQPGDPLLPSVSVSRVSLINIKTADHSIDIRRHSMTTGDELKGLRLTPSLTAGLPSVSMDRLSIDGRNKKNKEGVHLSAEGAEMAHSTAPSSLMAINESFSGGDEDNQAGQPIQRSSSIKNGGELTRSSSGTRHSITFECQTTDNAITYTVVRCSVLNDNNPQGRRESVDPVSESTVTTVTANTAAAASELATSSGSSLSRRASLLLPTRRKFEKLARRFGAGTFVATSSVDPATVVEPQTSSAAEISTKRMLKSETEWSTGSYPSSPAICSKGEHHLESSPSPTESDVPSAQVHVTNTVPPTSHATVPAASSTAKSNNPSTRSANNTSNHKNSTRSGDQDENELASDGGMDPSSSDSGTMARCTVVRPLKIRFCRPSSSGSVNKKSSKAKRQVIDTGRVVVREKDPARERRRISRQREKRATLILGLIMGAFIACWLPFFFLYLLAPVCPSCNIQPWGFAFAFWLGYINSALNPVIYTIFNKDFRRAFRRIIFRCTISHY